jgi:hypothetical protein
MSPVKLAGTTALGPARHSAIFWTRSGSGQSLTENRSQCLALRRQKIVIRRHSMMDKGGVRKRIFIGDGVMLICDRCVAKAAVLISKQKQQAARRKMTKASTANAEHSRKRTRKAALKWRRGEGKKLGRRSYPSFMAETKADTFEVGPVANHPRMTFAGYGVTVRSKVGEHGDMFIREGRRDTFKTADEAKAVAQRWFQEERG